MALQLIHFRSFEGIELIHPGQEPWSSGNGRRLLFRGCEIESQRWISHIFFVKFVTFVWKDENKQKEAEGGALKNNGPIL